MIDIVLNSKEKQKKIVSYLFDKQQLVTPSFVEYLQDDDTIDNLFNLFIIQNIDNFDFYKKELAEKFKITIEKKWLIPSELDLEKYKGFDYEKTHKVHKIFNYVENNKERKVSDFVAVFTKRYNAIKAMLSTRSNTFNTLSISRVLKKTESEEITIIGLVFEKKTTKNGHIIFNMEDPTGYINVLFNKNKEELLEIAKGCMLDEVIGIVGKNKGDIIFAEDIIFPDIPMVKTFKQHKDDVYSLFLGDIHYGSKLFIENEFLKFLKWLNGEIGSDVHKKIVKKIKYIFLVGDLVEGIGIYPRQEDELNVKDIYAQYREFAKLLNKIPPHIKIIICGGNHDAMRIAEPQPELDYGFADIFYELPNVELVTNPSYLTIEKYNDFPGFDILMYHGFSITHYADQVEYIRNQGGQDRVDLVLEYFLKRRHLAPTHSSTFAIPDDRDDFLLIKKVPDFFVTGHIHRLSVSKYNGVINLSCSCWSKISSFQEKLGLHPQPGRIILTNLKTRKVNIIDFFKEY